MSVEGEVLYPSWCRWLVVLNLYLRQIQKHSDSFSLEIRVFGSSSLPPGSRACCLSMAWIWMVPVAGAVLLWAISLGRILSYPAPSCVPPSPQFMPPLRDDRRSRNVLLVVAHPDDESMYATSPCVLSAQLQCLWNICLVLVFYVAWFLLFYHHLLCCYRFFAPTILFLKSKGHSIHILCMSRG
jgi:N-acetylglucosaminylphosphatidylinositol deacetylase